MTGEQLRVARINEGFSIRCFAREVGVPEQTIRRLETGQPISLPNAKKLADHFGITVLDLMPDLAERAA